MYISTLPEVVRNLALAATAITIATSLFLVNPLATLTVLLGFISLVFELLGNKCMLMRESIKDIKMRPEDRKVSS
jgi:hypothetical protein